MGCSRKEFAGLLEEVWNPAARSLIGARPVGEDAPAFAEMLWNKLKRFEPAIIRQAMEAELTRPEHRPDIRNIEQPCVERSPAAEPNMGHERQDRSRVVKFEFGAGDQTALAAHVCDSTGPIDAAWYDRAAQLCEDGLCLFPDLARRRLAPVYRRWAERKMVLDARKGKCVE